MPRFRVKNQEDETKEAELKLDKAGNLDLYIEGELVLSLMVVGRLLTFRIDSEKTGLQLDAKGHVLLAGRD